MAIVNYLRSPAAYSVVLLSLSPCAHPVGHTLVKVGRTHNSFYTSEPHPVSYFVAHSGEGDSQALALQLLDGVQQRVAGGGVYKIHRIRIHKHMLGRRAGSRQRSL